MELNPEAATLESKFQVGSIERKEISRRFGRPTFQQNFQQSRHQTDV
jgi:hypothetical protein